MGSHSHTKAGAAVTPRDATVREASLFLPHKVRNETNKNIPAANKSTI